MFNPPRARTSLNLTLTAIAAVSATWSLPAIAQVVPDVDPAPVTRLATPPESVSPSEAIGADLGDRPTVNGKMHSDVSLDPSGETLTLPKGKQREQKKMAVWEAILRIGATPVRKPYDEWMRTRASADYAERSAEAGAFSVFRTNFSRYTPSAANSSTFANYEDEFDGVVEEEYGFCWGVTTMNRRFAQLAFFRPSPTIGIPASERLPSPVVSRNRWVKEILRRCDAVMDGEATVFPGIRNMRELTLIPEVERHLKIRAADAWRDLAIRPWDRSFFANTLLPMTESEREPLLADLALRISRHELPKLMFTARTSSMNHGVPTWIHTVLVEGLTSLPDGTKRINIWDPDFYGEDQERNPKFLEIRRDGTILFAPWYEVENKTWSDRIGQVFYAPENDAETLRIEKSLLAFCTRIPKFCEGTNP